MGDERKRKGFLGKEKEIGRRVFFYYRLLVLVFRRSIGWGNCEKYSFFLFFFNNADG